MPLDLTKIQPFHPGLFYAQEPESDPEIIDSTPEGLYRYMEIYVTQQTDIFDALCYLSQDVLPNFDSSFHNFTPDQLIQLIKTVHKKAASTIMNIYHETSGEYAQSPVLRWQHSTQMQGVLFDFFNNQISKARLNVVAAELGVNDFVQFEKFITLLTKLKKNTTIPTEGLIPDNSHPFSYLLAKLSVAYNHDLLSPDEKNTVKAFVQVCMLPNQYEQAMQDYAVRTVERLANSVALSDEELSHVLAEIFYEFVLIHPFANGNGRTATLLLNFYLVVLNKPSILLRLPGEKTDPTSLYCQAFEEIEHSRKKLGILIHQRISNPTFEDPMLCETAIMKANLYEKTKTLEQSMGRRLMMEANHRACSAFALYYKAHPDEYSLEEIQFQASKTVFCRIENTVKNLAYEEEIKNPKEFLVKAISKLTQTELNWKYQKPKEMQSQAILWVEHSNEEILKETSQKIREIDPNISITLSRRADNGTPVLKLTQLDFKTLHDAYFSLRLTSMNQPSEDLTNALLICSF